MAGSAVLPPGTMSGQSLEVPVGAVGEGGGKEKEEEPVEDAGQGDPDEGQGPEDDGESPELPELPEEEEQMYDYTTQPVPEDDGVPPEEEEETYEYSEKQVQEMRQAFRVYDKYQTDAVAIRHLGSLLRALSLNPTEAQLSAAAKWLEADPRNGVVRFKEFLIIMGRTLKDRVTEEHVLQAFRKLDEDKEGVVSRERLQDVLTTTGEKLYPDEFAAFIKCADPRKKGVVHYEQFILDAIEGRIGKKKKKRRKKRKKKKKKKVTTE